MPPEKGGWGRDVGASMVAMGPSYPHGGWGVVDGGGWSRPDQAKNNLKKVHLFVIYLWSGY